MRDGVFYATIVAYPNEFPMKTRPAFTLKMPMITALTVGGLCAAACAFSWHGFTLVEWWRESRSGRVLWRANAPSKMAALTFDDGPDPRYTPRILEILNRYGVKATFFLEGKQVQANPELARTALAQGHVIGNHTFTHPYLNRLSARAVRAELTDCDRCLETNLHLKTHLFRPPRGEWNPIIFREAKRDGDDIILWTVAVEHQEAKTPRAMAARALRLIRPGGILLLHDGGSASRENTVKALPLLLDGLKKRGYRCVTVPELLHIRGDEALSSVPTRTAPPPAL